MHILAIKFGPVYNEQVPCPPINVCDAGQATHNKPARFSPVFTGQVHSPQSPPVLVLLDICWLVDTLSTKLRFQTHIFRIGPTWAFIKHVGMPEVDLPVSCDAKLEPLPVVGEP